MENDTKDNSIDDETVDLFALMNSTVVELQMELEILESREYEREEIDHNDAGETKIVPERPTSTDTDKSQETKPQRCDAIEETITSAKPTSVDWEPMTPVKVGDRDYAPVSDYSPGKVAVVAGVKERTSEEEEAPEIPPLFTNIAPAKLGDEDYVPVSDFTNTATAETISNAIARATKSSNFTRV